MHIFFNFKEDLLVMLNDQACIMCHGNADVGTLAPNISTKFLNFVHGPSGLALLQRLPTG